MLVRELIGLLCEFPSDMPVLVDGYEFGFDVARPPCLVKVKRSISKPTYAGEFQHEENNYGVETESEAIEAVLISRKDS